MEKNIGVLGGGISGLTFASLIKDADVLEKEAIPGGLMRSIKQDGYTFDLGSHIIFSKNKDAVAFMLRALGENQIMNRRNTAIFYKGIKVKYPFENGLGDLPKQEAFECLSDYSETYAKRESGELEMPKNFHAWMHYRFGKSITEKYLYPYNRKIWDYPPEKMDLFWVEGRIPQPPLKDVIKAAMGLESEGYTHQLHFHYPAHGGIQAVTDGIASTIDRRRLLTGFEVTKVRKEDGKWVVGGNKGERIYDHLVNTLHIRDFIDSYEDAPKEVREAAKNLKWNSVHLVMIGLGKAKLNDLHWAYIPDEDVLPNRISFPSNMSPHTTPKGCTSVLAETTFSPDGDKAKLTDITERTIEALQRIGILESKDIVFTKLVTCRHAYVVYDLDYQKNIKTIEDFAAGEGITLLGRWGEFRYHNSDRCVENAMEKAKQFLRTPV